MKAATFCLLFFISTIAAAQGKYAGPVLKKLINKTYVNSRILPIPAGYLYLQGSLVSALNDPEKISAEIYQKGTTVLVIFSKLTDTVKRSSTILDVLEIKGVLNGWRVVTTFCRQDRVNNFEIVALAKKSKADYLTEIKLAWYFNRAKRQFLAIPVNGLDCFNERGD